MIFGNRVRQLREDLLLTKQDLADMMGVSVATINNWENWKSSPTSSNLRFLAITLNTTMDYLQGLTDNPSLEDTSAKAEKISPNVTPMPDEHFRSQENNLELSWPENFLNSYELASRRKRSHSARLLSLDRNKREAVFQASTSRNGDIYITTPKTCTCRDFTVNSGKLPCKHIFRLLEELGLFTSEYFKPDEYDYTMKITPQSETSVSNSEPVKEAESITVPSMLISEPTAVTPEPVKSDTPEMPHSRGILMKFLKYTLCCLFGFWAITFTVGAMTQGNEWLCFPVAFAVAGFLTASTARRKAVEGSVFKWWLYGAFVPVVSWIDIVMANAQNKTKGFLKGIAYSILGIMMFLIIFVQFLPPVSAR